MKNITLIDKARNMLNYKKLPTTFWPKVVTTSSDLFNVSSIHVVPYQTPYVARRGVKPNVSHLKTFGCIAFSHVPSHTIQILDDRALRRIFIGYSTESNTYKLYNFIIRKVIISRDVTFLKVHAGIGIMGSKLHKKIIVHSVLDSFPSPTSSTASTKGQNSETLASEEDNTSSSHRDVASDESPLSRVRP